MAKKKSKVMTASQAYRLIRQDIGQLMHHVTQMDRQFTLNFSKRLLAIEERNELPQHQHEAIEKQLKMLAYQVKENRKVMEAILKLHGVSEDFFKKDND